MEHSKQCGWCLFASDRVLNYLIASVFVMFIFLVAELLAFFVFDNLVVGTFFMGLLFGTGGAIAAVAVYVIGTRKL